MGVGAAGVLECLAGSWIYVMAMVDSLFELLDTQ